MKCAFKKLAFFMALPLAGAGLSQGYVVAQQSGTARVNVERQHAGEHKAKVGMDQVIVHCIHLATQEEIDFAKFGHQNSQNRDVQAFAKQLIQDHTELAKSLPQKFVLNPSRTDAESTSVQIAPADGENKTIADRLAGVIDSLDGEERTVLKPAVPAETPNQGDAPLVSQEPQAPRVQVDVKVDGQAPDMLKLQSEIAEQCLQDAKAKLGKEQGERFDQSFVGFQIAMHQSLQSKLKVFERHASPEVKPLVTKSLQTTQKHLQQAEALMAKLDEPVAAQR